MIIDRQPFFNSIGTITGGDALHVTLQNDDVDRLYNDGAITNRFMECALNGIGIPGWSPEDKIHVFLDESESAALSTKLADLTLDAGGDMYLTLLYGRALQAASNREVIEVSPEFPRIDPSNHFNAVGVRALCLFNLRHLGNRISGVHSRIS